MRQILEPEPADQLPLSLPTQVGIQVNCFSAYKSSHHLGNMAVNCTGEDVDLQDCLV